jgi:hypothetical protein
MRQVLALAALLTLAALAGVAQAQPAAHRAGLVVQYGDGSVETACVRFAEDEISGLDLLDRSGIAYVAQQSSIGAAVCKIGGQGCDYPSEGCFCQRDGPRSLYWAYQIGAPGGWRYSNLGAANVRVHDGDVNGWAWGAGDSDAGAAPPPIDLAAICGPAAMPTARATASVAAAAMPSAAAPPAPPASPVASPLSAADTTGQPAAWAGYLGFAAIAATLLAGIGLAARRRRP